MRTSILPMNPMTHAMISIFVVFWREMIFQMMRMMAGPDSMKREAVMAVTFRCPMKNSMDMSQ